MAIATPTLYAAVQSAGVVYAINVNEGTGTIFVAADGSGHDAEVKVTPDAGEYFQPAGVAVDETYLYLTSSYNINDGPNYDGRVTRIRLKP